MAAARRRQRGGAGGARWRRGGGGGRGVDPSHMAACDTPKSADASRAAGALWDGFCWGISPWDTNKVEAALKARGLNPVADHSGKDFQSFHVKDPDGMDVQISNGTRKNRRQGTGERKAQRRAAVRADGLQDGVPRPHLVPVHELQGDGRVLRGAPRLEGSRRRREPERDADLAGDRRPADSRRQRVDARLRDAGRAPRA